MMRLKAYRWMDIEARSYWKPQEAQMISTMVECLQGIQIAKEATAPVLTGGSLVTDGRVTQIFRKEKMRSNNSNDGNYLLLRGILWKLMSSNVL
jgi:hypothetical protein